MKVWNFMMIMLTMIIFLSFLGISTTNSEGILGNMSISINQTTGELIDGDISSSGWFTKLFGDGIGLLLVGLATAGAVVVGLFTKSFEWKLVLLPFFTGLVVKFASVGWSIVQLAQTTSASWLIAAVATVFLPLTVMFIFSIVEWFGGVGG